jgi:capsular polysaccharide biosynthesis protein
MASDLQKNLIGRFFWRPSGCVPTLRDLDESHGVLAKWNGNGEYREDNSSRHHPTVVELAEGKIVDDLRLVASRCDIVAGGLQSIWGVDRPQDHYLLHRQRFRTHRRWHGTALLLGASNGDNYYHWLFDILPRWKLLEDAGYTRKDYDYVLLGHRPFRFQDETLDRLNVPKEKRLRCNKHFIHHFSRLVVPAMPFPVWRVAPWTCEWVRSLFPERRGGPERIYISRRSMACRRLVNEAELETRLENLGFVCLQPERMSVADQALSFGAARWVVAPHGAGLANLVFAPRGAKVIEILHPVNQTPCYQNLALACGLNYSSWVGAHTPGPAQPRDREADFTIDVARVVRLLSENG